MIRTYSKICADPAPTTWNKSLIMQETASRAVSNNTLLLLLGLLFFVLPIGHTIALRYLAFVLLAALTLYLYATSHYHSTARHSTHGELTRVSILLAVMTGWILAVSLANVDRPFTAFSDIKSDWIFPLMYFFLAIVLGAYSLRQNESTQYNIYLTIFTVMFIHVLYVDLHALKHYLDHKELLTRFAGLAEGPDKSNYITNILLAFLIPEIIYRLRTGKRLLRVNNPILALLILLLLCSSIVEATRNGVAAIILIGVLGTLFFFVGNKGISKRVKIFSGVALTLSLIAPMLYNINQDERWTRLIDTLPIARDTQQNRFWLNSNKYSVPKLPNGEYVELSTYLRVSWLTEGFKIIGENPWGIGYAKNAFGHAIKEKYDDAAKNIGHSHSGALDLTIGTGIPGLIIWLSFGIYLCYLSYIYFLRYESVFALILFFNVAGFYSRFLVDSIMRDHMFLTFMFITGFALIFMLRDRSEHIQSD